MTLGQRNFIDADNLQGFNLATIDFGLDVPVKHALNGTLPKIVFDADILNGAIEKG